jgi:hypothetical protein
MTMPDPRAYRRLAALLRDRITKRHDRPERAAPADRGTAPSTWAFPADSHQGDGRPSRRGAHLPVAGLGYFVADKDE